MVHGRGGRLGHLLEALVRSRCWASIGDAKFAYALGRRTGVGGKGVRYEIVPASLAEALVQHFISTMGQAECEIREWLASLPRIAQRVE